MAARCIKDGLVGGAAFAVSASMILADAHRHRGVAKIEDLDPMPNRAIAESVMLVASAEGDLAGRSGGP